MRFILSLVLGLFCLPIWSSNAQIENHGIYKEVPESLKHNLTPLFGHVPRDVRHALRIAPMDLDQELKLSIVLPWNNQEELDKKLDEITNPRNPNFRNYMSQKEFYARYAPNLDHVNQVKDYMAQHGLKHESVDENNLIIHVSGKVQNINNIFNTEIYHYSDPTGQRFYAPAYELQIAREIKILAVQGLENRIKARPYYKILNDKLSMAAGYSPAQINSAYSLSGYTGAGQTLALFELDGFNASDITAYEKAFGLPNVPLQTILVDNATGIPGDGAGEVTLDIELMIAVAPQAAKILIYEGPNSGAGIIDTYNKIATDNLAKSISSSWGIYESASPSSFLQSENQIFKQMVAQGQVMYAAAGDSGAYDDGSHLSVDDPASQPYVVGVGGTSLFINSDGSYNHEVTWSSGQGPGQSGGGGGISTVWSIPSYQQGAISGGSLGSQTMRNVPDVALNADPYTGYAIYFNGTWQVFGGTSCAAPLWAAFTALVDQQRAATGQTNIGFVSPLLYSLGQSSNYASTFHDISDKSTNGYYPATTGYDLATGWGSFNGNNLISYLTGNNPNPPTCSHAYPTVTLSPSSQQGQPGATLSYQVSVVNNDSNNCPSSTFNLTSSMPSGFSQSLANNTLSIAPGQSASTTLSVTSSTNASSGNYAFSVTALNSSATSYASSASGTYIVNNPSSPQLLLTVSPQNGRFIYDSYRYASFQISLLNNNKGLQNPVNISIRGPISHDTSYSTGSSGILTYKLLLNRAIPPGIYTMTLSSTYQGSTVTTQTTFSVNLWQ